MFAWLNPDIMDILLITFTFLSAGLFIGQYQGWGAVFRIDALWPGLLVSALAFFSLSLLREQSQEEKEKINHFLS